MNVSEKAVLIATLFLSILALFVSIRQTNIMSDMRQASVWPYVQIGTNFTPQKISIEVDNDGVGPAKIREMTYHYQDTTYYQIHNFVEDIALKKDLNIGKFSFSNLEGGRQVLKAEENREILKIEGTSTLIDSILYLLQDVSIRIKYCSIYDDCWINDDGNISKTK